MNITKSGNTINLTDGDRGDVTIEAVTLFEVTVYMVQTIEGTACYSNLADALNAAIRALGYHDKSVFINWLR